MMNRSELESKLLSLAAEDPTFRSLLVKDPAAAISQATGIQLPEGLEITVFEETPSRLALVLPATADPELSDADLASVSGGVHENGTLFGK